MGVSQSLKPDRSCQASAQLPHRLVNSFDAADDLVGGRRGRIAESQMPGRTAGQVKVPPRADGSVSIADLYLVAALLVCVLGYAEGGRLAGHLPGWHVIAWAVVLALPISLAITLIAVPHERFAPTLSSLVGLAYIAGISQLGGFVVWYRGMGIIGVAKASQLQLAQPLLTLVWSVLLMNEHLPLTAPVTAVVVLLCIVVTQRTRFKHV
jgi:drug/metabolite transporter (DMT)-like permease